MNDEQKERIYSTPLRAVTDTVRDDRLAIIASLNRRNEDHPAFANIFAQSVKMLALLETAITAWPQFDDPDHPVNGADLVDWFASFRRHAHDLVQRASGQALVVTEQPSLEAPEPIDTEVVEPRVALPSPIPSPAVVAAVEAPTRGAPKLTVVRRQIDQDVLNVLAGARMAGDRLQIERQLDRELYVRTNEVLEALGGKWDRKAKAHVFDGDAATVVDEAVLTGEFTRSKQDFGFFETPAWLVEQLIAAADVRPGHRILEPSAGRGAIAKQLREFKYVEVACVEIQLANVRALNEIGFYQTVIADFLAWEPAEKFDRVVMNPPFAQRADIRHIMHAFRFLKPGGKLASIASAAVIFRDDNLATSFRELVAIHDGEIVALPEGSFKESGTMVNTALVTMTKKEAN